MNCEPLAPSQLWIVCRARLRSVALLLADFFTFPQKIMALAACLLHGWMCQIIVMVLKNSGAVCPARTSP